MSFVPIGPFVDLLRGWLVHVVGVYALISRRSRTAALEDVKTIAAQLSDSDLSALDSWPLQFEASALTCPEDFTEATWGDIAKLYARTGHWGRLAGPDPTSPACKCPKSILARNNITPEACARGRFTLPERGQP